MTFLLSSAVAALAGGYPPGILMDGYDSRASIFPASGAALVTVGIVFLIALTPKWSSKLSKNISVLLLAAGLCFVAFGMAVPTRFSFLATEWRVGPLWIIAGILAVYTGTRLQKALAFSLVYPTLFLAVMAGFSAFYVEMKRDEWAARWQDVPNFTKTC